MDKIAKQLMLIAKDYKFAETKEEIKNIFSNVKIAADDANPQVQQEAIDKNINEAEKAKAEAENAQTPQEKKEALNKAEEWFEKAKKSLEETKEIKEDISVIRDRLAKEVSNWNSCLKEIKKIFSGDKGFEEVIKALKSNKYFKTIGIKLSKSFDKVYDQVKDYHIDLMDDKKFIELVNDSKSGYSTNLIDPFVDLYNGYMDKFEELEKLYEKLTKEKQKELSDSDKALQKMIDDQAKRTENDENGDGETYKQVIEQKHKFSKKLFKIASELENILG